MTDETLLASGHDSQRRRQMDEQAGGNSGAVERSPSGTIGGSKANPLSGR